MRHKETTPNDRQRHLRIAMPLKKIKMNKLELIKLYAEQGENLVGQNAVRPGYLKIDKVIDLVVNTRVEKLLVSAWWHPTSLEAAILLPVNVQLSTLFTKRSVGLKEIDPAYFPGAVILVTNVESYDAHYQGRDYKSIFVEWELLDFGNSPISPSTLINNKGSLDLDSILDQKPSFNDYDFID
jgi:hypothetical protein